VGKRPTQIGEQLQQYAGELSPVPLLWHSAPLQDRSVRAPKRHTSQSSLRTFATCPRRYFYAKVLSLPEEDSLAMRFGSLFHEVMKELGEEFPARDKMHGAAAKGRAGDIIEGVLRRRDDKSESPLVERSICHYLERMVRQFFELDMQRSDHYTIRMVESPLAFTYGNVDFIGIVDRLDESKSGRQVVIDYKTGKIEKTGKSIRKNVIESAEKPDKRDWQIPLYAYGVLSKGAKPPLVFSYYNVQAGEKPNVVSLIIDEVEAPLEPDSLFTGSRKDRFAHLRTDEVRMCMDDAVRLAQSIFAPTHFFRRTEDENHCGFCSYRTVCKRGVAWN
jgi:CRISPR/Cas system-associated exonuclease Cas4 (RecB family)